MPFVKIRNNLCTGFENNCHAPMKPHLTFGVVREVKRSRSFKMAMDPMDREPNVYNRETNVYDNTGRG